MFKTLGFTAAGVEHLGVGFCRKPCLNSRLRRKSASRKMESELRHFGGWDLGHLGGYRVYDAS